MAEASEVAVLELAAPLAQVAEERAGVTSGPPGFSLSNSCIMWAPLPELLTISQGAAECPSCRAGEAVGAR